MPAVISRKKSAKVRERIPNPVRCAISRGRIFYPVAFRLGARGSSGAFRWPDHETRKVALATDSCPQGSPVRFQLGGRVRFGLTKSNPFFEDGKLWVHVCGFDQAFPFAFLRVVSTLPPL